MTGAITGNSQFCAEGPYAFGDSGNVSRHNRQHPSSSAMQKSQTVHAQLWQSVNDMESVLQLEHATLCKPPSESERSEELPEEFDADVVPSLLLTDIVAFFVVLRDDMAID